MATVNKYPGEFLRHHQGALSQVVAAAGIWGVADLCEQKEIISSDMKDKIVSDSTGRTEKDRASLLIDTVRRLLIGYESDTEQLEEFLCILFDKSGRSGKSVIKTITQTYKSPLLKFNALIHRHYSTAQDSDVIHMFPAQTNNISIQPGQALDVRSLYDALQDLVKWEKFALKLPDIRQPDIDRIKIENNGDIEGQKTALYDKWLRVDVNASWQTVVDSLESVNEHVLARHITERLQLTRHSSSPVIYPQQRGIQHLSHPSDSTIQNEEPDSNFDSKLLFDKSPKLEDILIAVPTDCDSEQFRNVLKVPLDGDFRTAISVWIEREPTDVTWRNILKALIGSSRKGTARTIINNFLKKPSVYNRYINEKDYDVLDV